jgi:hypothetical protein
MRVSKRPAKAKPRTTLLPERLRHELLVFGPSFDAAPFALDLYRLVCIVLADKSIGKLVGPDYLNTTPIQELQDRYRGGELIRILISSAVALRILFDQRPRDPISKRMVSRFDSVSKRECGQLWSRWPKDKRKPEPLTLREACNKIIHAEDIKDDIMVPDLAMNPDLIGTYIRPFLDLYGTKNGQKWRAKLSIIEFAQHGAFAFLREMP